MTVHADNHPVLVGMRRHPFGRSQRGRRGNESGAERLCHQKAPVDLLVSETVIKADIVSLDFDARIAEFFADAFEMVHWNRQPPFAQLLARSLARSLVLSARSLPTASSRRPGFDMAGKKLAFTDADGGHGLDGVVQRKSPEAIRLYAYAH